MPGVLPSTGSQRVRQDWATENNRMGKTRDLFKKIRDSKGIFHADMGTINERNSTDLTEAEDIKKRWEECTDAKKIYAQKIFMTEVTTVVISP